jgi:3-deoxy-D-manno-octulosonic-acid transferase
LTPTLPLGLYRAATALLEPVAPPVLRARARRGKEDAERLDERLGRASLPRPPGPLAWLHGVSVGETMSLLPLASALKTRRPDLNLLVTSGTLTSARLLAERLPAGVIHQFAPVDAPGAVAGFLDHWRPALGIFVESELWPNLILAAGARDIRLALISARMTEASARGWSRAPRSVRVLLSAFDLVLAQDAATDARLQRLGARTGPRLNLKTVADQLPFEPAELARLAPAIGGRKVLLAASTHEGEEQQVAAAAPPDALLVIAPRHPERGAQLAQALSAPRRSAGEPPDSRSIYVADTLGELGLFMRLADVVVMGGGWAEGVRGHNPLEAARLGKAVVSGPNVGNAADTYADLVAAGAALIARDRDALAFELARLLADPAAAASMGAAGKAYAGEARAALDSAFGLLQPLLPP